MSAVIDKKYDDAMNTLLTHTSYRLVGKPCPEGVQRFFFYCQCGMATLCTLLCVVLCTLANRFPPVLMRDRDRIPRPADLDGRRKLGGYPRVGRSEGGHTVLPWLQYAMATKSARASHFSCSTLDRERHRLLPKLVLGPLREVGAT